MTREWQPGEVGLDLRWGYRGIFIKDCGTHLRESCWHNQSGFADPGTDDRRPLVVIDPEDRKQMRRIAECAADGDAAEWRVDMWQRYFREFADPKPPKPEEPTGLGAVVEDETGRTWVRTHNHWRREDLAGAEWSTINAVRVLSEGVQA